MTASALPRCVAALAARIPIRSLRPRAAALIGDPRGRPGVRAPPFARGIAISGTALARFEALPGPLLPSRGHAICRPIDPPYGVATLPRPLRTIARPAAAAGNPRAGPAVTAVARASCRTGIAAPPGRLRALPTAGSVARLLPVAAGRPTCLTRTSGTTSTIGCTPGVPAVAGLPALATTSIVTGAPSVLGSIEACPPRPAWISAACLGSPRLASGGVLAAPASPGLRCLSRARAPAGGAVRRPAGSAC